GSSGASRARRPCAMRNAVMGQACVGCRGRISNGSLGAAWRTGSGFTLFEMLAVLLLLSIAVGAVSLSVARSLESARVNSVSRDLAAALRYTRGQAIVKGQEQVITFNLRNWTYQVPGRAAVKLPEGMELRVRTAA